ncbi:hypothetical protein [Zunongwangia endophytica]|uniref:DUF3649 domain-containing protein n=1 Tax=Zunongwangia endophytica TaxID=1808945 RepID=A0ABV8HC89_9FLAO|nr:hypothetical protein [Zunongwangia endophytica]MDN3593942.1 hypothetical protein [Zunongwangia endophytica]
MPANKKHLTKSFHQKFAKLTAGFLGGYAISALFHMLLAFWLPDHKLVLITSIFTLFLLWMVLLIIPYLFKNGWKIWGIYFLITLLLYGGVYFGKLYHPII